MNLGKKDRNSIMRIKFFNFSLIILFLTFFNSNYCLANNNEALFGNEDSKIIVKVFSSLTCPHCANFHKKIFEELRKALEEGDVVKLSGFGNFQLRNKPERPGRNPKTGEEIPISERRVVTFHASQKLKTLVEQSRGSEENNR